ncbi:hypothetical protein E2C01_017314 [Portunus trituberculatus]|uniref:Uncharacterized protein n=1 Tax=Portunus trituberculatus TaxID=210409 RepID=A0A5B7DT09_PORTR|nr:hypothetical protein [Portunus trituberculatus]
MNQFATVEFATQDCSAICKGQAEPRDCPANCEGQFEWLGKTNEKRRQHCRGVFGSGGDCGNLHPSHWCPLFTATQTTLLPNKRPAICLVCLIRPPLAARGVGRGYSAAHEA